MNTQEVIVVNGKHPILMTEDDIKEFNYAADCIGKELTPDEVIVFMVNNIGIYYRGKMYGFNDTEVREEICEALESKQ